jgi:hypothetical protein
MDDFGTGYSSFAHLVDFDLDRINIDKTFVQAAPTKGSALAVVRAVIQMARDLGVETIGEGVETVEQIGKGPEPRLRCRSGISLGPSDVGAECIRHTPGPSWRRALIAAH